MKKKLSNKRKLELLKEPIKITVKTLRHIAEECECLDSNGHADLHNMASWLEGVRREDPSYIPK